MVPPISYFVPCSSFLSKYGLQTTPTSTGPTPTYIPPTGLVDCASLVLNNQSLTGRTVVDTFSGTSYIEMTQACTAWAASSKSFADSPEGTAAAWYSACQAQAVTADVQRNPSLAGITGSVVVQIYPGSMLGSDYSEYRNSTSFPLPYSTANPPGGRITTVSNTQVPQRQQGSNEINTVAVCFLGITWRHWVVYQWTHGRSVKPPK